MRIHRTGGGGCFRAAAMLVLAASMSAARGQVVMPPMNLGGTSIIDGMSGPGILFEPVIVEGYFAHHFEDAQGIRIPGNNTVKSWSNLFHVAYISQHRILGGYYGAEFLVPIAHLDIETDSGPRGKATGPGDILISPLILSWPGHSLFHHAYFSRFAVLATLPTGQYSASQPVNIGSHENGFTAYYAFTLFLQPKWETSWRLHYLYNADDNDPFAGLQSSSTQPGQAFHLNYAASYEISPNLRLGINGYCLQQLTDHRINGHAIPYSKERVLAIGPALMLSELGWVFFANFDDELEARNRSEGYRLNITFRKIFPARQARAPIGTAPGR